MCASGITCLSLAAMYNMSGKEFKEESQRLNYFLKRHFGKTKEKEIRDYILSQSNPYQPLLEAHKSWVIDEILTAATAKERAFTIKRMIKLAKYLFEQGNYSGYLMTIGALNEKSILRLKKSWDEVSKKYSNWFTNQVKICFSGSYTDLLKIMGKKKGFYSPFLYALKKDPQKAVKFKSSFGERIIKWKNLERSQERSFWTRSILLE